MADGHLVKRHCHNTASNSSLFLHGISLLIAFLILQLIDRNEQNSEHKFSKQITWSLSECTEDSSDIDELSSLPSSTPESLLDMIDLGMEQVFEEELVDEIERKEG